MSTVNLRHHCIRLSGLEPESTRDCERLEFAAWDAMGFPVGKPIKRERFSVTADECHTGEYWSNFMLSNYAGRKFPGRACVQFIPN